MCILATKVYIDINAIENLAKKMKKLFGRTKFDFEILLFNQKEDQNFCKKNIHVRTFKRNMNLSDFSKRSDDYWSFLDEITISPVCKKKGWNKLMYKLWKHLGKKLKANGIIENF